MKTKKQAVIDLVKDARYSWRQHLKSGRKITSWRVLAKDCMCAARKVKSNQYWD